MIIIYFSLQITINADTYLANVLSLISSVSADSFIFLRMPVDKNV